MIGNETDEIIQELFNCLLQKYEKNLEESLKDSKFAFDSVNLLHSFYCLNCPRSFRTENELKIHENVCKNHDYCHTEMPEKSKNILKYNHREKSC